MEPPGASLKPPVYAGHNPTTNGRHWPKRVYQAEDSRWVNVETKEPEKIPEAFVQKKHKIAQQPPLPKLGILTHTTVESPAIRFIVPLSKNKHGHIDIACIGDTSLTLKRLGTTGTFRTLWKTHSIKSVIRNANIFGEYKLVLVLEDDDLIFVQFVGVAEGFKPIFTRYEVRERKLAGLTLGAKLANSTGYRFTAVACYSNMILILEANNENLSYVKNEGQNGLPKCVRRRRIVQLEGYIVQMDFLAPPKNDPYLVLLAVVTCNKGECRLHLLQWDDDPAVPWKIDEPHHGNHGYRLPLTVGLPTLLVPLAACDTAELLLVCENSIVRMKGLLDGDFKAMIVSLDLQELRPGPMHSFMPNSYTPLWVAWFQLYTSPHHFMLVREDGLHMEIISGLPLTNSINRSYPPKTSIVVSVTVKIPKSSDYASFVIFVEENGPAQVCKITGDEVRDKSGYQPIISLPNWSPLNDFVCTPAQHPELFETNTHANLKTTFSNQDVAASQTTRAIAYGVSGLGSQGQFSKLGGEIEAFVRFKLAGFEKVTGMWAVSGSILVSFADRSVLLRRKEDKGEWQSVPEEETWLDLTSRTFHVSFDCDVPFQVSSNSLTMHPESALSYNSPQHAYRIPQAGPQESVVAAASNNNYLCTLRSSSQDGCWLDICYLDKNALFEDSLSLLHHKYELNNSRNIAMAQIESTLVIAVSYAGAVHSNDSGVEEDSPAGSICLLVQESDIQGPGAKLVSSPNFTSIVLRPWNIPKIEDSISIAFLNMDSNPHNFLVVSGHGDGTLVVWECSLIPDGLGSHTKLFHKKLGNGEVQVIIDPSNSATALISCDGLVYRFTSRQSSRYSQLTKVALPASNRTNPGVSSKIQICNYGKDFLIHRDSEITNFELRQEHCGFLKLSENRFNVRPLALLGFLGPATCILAPLSFGGIITAGTKLQEDCKLVPLLVACKYDGSHLHGLVTWQQLPKKKPQTITCMIEIPTPNSNPPKLEGKNRTRLLVGTNRGSLVLLDVEFGKPARAPFQMNFHEPIHALLVHPDRPGLVYVCCGMDLLLIRLPEEAAEHGEDRIRASMELPSRGVAMNFLSLEIPENCALSVLTAEHSVITFTFGDIDARKHANHNIEYASIADKTERDGLDIFTMLDPDIGGDVVLVTDKDCTITGLYPPSGLTPGVPETYRRLFSAELSSSIKKLRVMDAAPVWDSQVDLSICRNYEKNFVRVSMDRSIKYPTLLGSGVHGALHQIRVLKEPLMQLLSFLQHFALQVPEMNPVPKKGQDNAKLKQTRYRMSENILTEIDGDLVKLWLVNRDLEEKLYDWSLGLSSGVLGPMHDFCASVLTWKPELMPRPVEKCVINEQGKLDLNKDVYEDLLHEHVEEVYELLEYLFRPLF